MTAIFDSFIKNILWDIDGTLFDTYPATTYAISKSLNGMGLPIALNVIDGLVRQSFEHCVLTLSQRFKLEPDLLRHQIGESYSTISPANQPPFPGVSEICKWIHQSGGLNIIVTHRSEQSTRALLENHNLSPWIDDIFSVEQGFPRKPDPGMAKAALKKHSLKPAETLLVGDRDLDIQAGQAAGVHTCLFGQAKLTAPADFQVDHYNQLLPLLQEGCQ